MTLQTLTRTTGAVLAAVALGTVLSACAPLMIGGAAVGTMMAADRRTAGTQVEDETIELRAGNRLRDNFGNRVHVNVTSYNRQVLLTGKCPPSRTRSGWSRRC